ncbi:hypothetical protein L1987_67089 [Smallanthus sonchifolius]|uniref:Uncharacterized protein n=1 Tax=Smallanthus sonchifolius TaxID=185202 RepID=A0ACB9BYX3_9ASTR|nr:hypothetical protein L1987_67089 [Smallanthus sonchifolius]
MATRSFFQEVELPEQRTYGDGVLFPALLSPTTNTNTNTTAFEEAIRAEKTWLESLLHKSGVILFRGFPVTTPSDFNNVVEAFGFPEFSYLGGRAPRTQIIGRVYTANESPLDKRIPFHHELAYNLDFPSKLFFYCEEEPGKGGETPIVLSHIVCEKMKERYPEFVAKLEEHGLTYITITGDEDDASAIGGTGWKSAYMTDDKNIAEERAAKLGSKLEWNGNAVKIKAGPRQTIRFDKGNQRKIWFFNHGFGPVKSNIDEHDTYCELGNGDLVPEHAIKDCMKIMEEECVAIPWKKGDVMLVNNLMALHSRMPLLKPPRRVLASLCK